MLAWVTQYCKAESTLKTLAVPVVLLQAYSNIAALTGRKWRMRFLNGMYLRFIGCGPYPNHEVFGFT